MEKTNFNGNRLREARIYRGYSITDLANKLDISKQMFSKYENNKSAPSFEMLLKLIDILKFPKDYFYESGLEVTTGNTYFKSLLSTTKRDRKMQNDRIKYLTVIRHLLEEYIDFPELDLPNLSIDDTDDIEDVTMKIRSHWNIMEEPIDNMVQLLEENGFVLTALKTDNKAIDAFGSNQDIKGSNYYVIVLGDDKRSFYRRQFTAAHELAHKVLHDPQLNTDDITKEEFKKIEEEANEFASAFLLPRDAFIKDVSMHPVNLNYYKHLKKKWKVSISAMIVRAHRLGVISTNQYSYLQRQISKRNWRTIEPFDDTKYLEEPVALRQAIELLLENGILDGEEFIRKLSKEYGLSLYREEVEMLLGLEEDYLKVEKNNGQVINMTDLRKSLEIPSAIRDSLTQFTSIAEKIEIPNIEIPTMDMPSISTITSSKDLVSDSMTKMIENQQIIANSFSPMPDISLPVQNFALTDFQESLNNLTDFISNTVRGINADLLDNFYNSTEVFRQSAVNARDQINSQGYIDEEDDLQQFVGEYLHDEELGDVTDYIQNNEDASEQLATVLDSFKTYTNDLVKSNKKIEVNQMEIKEDLKRAEERQDKRDFISFSLAIYTVIPDEEVANSIVLFLTFIFTMIFNV
ncbi:helix-turn-helix domain-containing protein [Salicibibacter kimchii]|nr:XRE family transcriptional regulator [Salicibibacter kimchii]